MTKLCLRKLENDLQLAVREMLPLLKAEESENGIAVEMQQGTSLTIEATPMQVVIFAPFKAAFIRGLKLFLLEREKREAFSVEEKVCIPACGIMLDLSRNAVMRVAALKQYIREMALRGLNTLYLYMEDVYTMPEHPYFGYMRGRYTADELREVDRYGLLLGVEVVPHIQTLGHMEQYIKWDEGMAYRDTERVLIAGEENTYQLIDDMLRSLSQIFTTKRIHLGMDEAGNLGSGKFYGKNGYVPRAKILLNHLKRVLESTEKYGLQPIIYGDTVYATLSGDQYASKLTEIPPEVKKQIDGNLSLVYWQYGGRSVSEYADVMEKYQTITKDLIYWGGIWSWFGFLPDNRYTLECSDPALIACKELGIREAIASIWGDNGTECNHFLNLFGMQLYAEHMYHAEVSQAHLKQYFEGFTGASYDACLDMSDFHNNFLEAGEIEYYVNRYYGKRYFWSDILVGLLDKDLEEKPMSGHYRKLAAKFRDYQAANDRWKYWYGYAEKLMTILAKKCYLAENLKKAYDAEDRAFLAQCVDTLLPELKELYADMRKVHMDQWLATYKPFGWEVLDVRYGGMISRIGYAIERLSAYLDGSLDKIEELEPERLLHRCEWTADNFSSIITACFHV